MMANRQKLGLASNHLARYQMAFHALPWHYWSPCLRLKAVCWCTGLALQAWAQQLLSMKMDCADTDTSGLTCSASQAAGTMQTAAGIACTLSSPAGCAVPLPCPCTALLHTHLPFHSGPRTRCAAPHAARGVCAVFPPEGLQASS
jgi:hypothetical protein